jgi:hypothetical protein
MYVLNYCNVKGIVADMSLLYKAAAKAMPPSINDVLHDSKLDISGFPSGVAEASRPYRQYTEENRPDSGIGRKRTRETTVAQRVCWQGHFLWSQILNAVRVVGLPWSPTEILRHLQRSDPVAFERLTTQVIGNWIDRTGAMPVWKDWVLKKAEEGRDRGVVTRKSILDPYPEVKKDIKDQLLKLRVAGIAMDTNRARGIIVAHLQFRAPEVFAKRAKDGSYFRCTDSWVKKFLHENLRWTFRRATRAAQKLPANLDHVLRENFLRLALTFRNGVIEHAVFFVNADQTYFHMQPTSTSTFEEVGSKQVSVLGKEEKRAATMLVAATPKGLLPMHLIYGGKTKASLPRKGCIGLQEALDLGFLIDFSGTDSYWSTFELMCKWVDRILAPHFAREKELVGAPDDQECTLYIDVWSVHRSIAFRTWLDKNYLWIKYRYVPAGTTGLAQPCDVGIQRPLKLMIKRAQHADIVEETLGLLRAGTPAADLRLDTSLPTLRDRSVNWVVQAYKAINKPEIIQKV